MKLNKKLIAPIVTLCAFAAIGVGSTYALFTSNAESNINITSGKVEVTSALGSLATYSAKADASGTVLDEYGNKYVQVATDTTGVFSTKGTATISGDSLVISNMAPGDKVTVVATVSNNSNISIKHRLNFIVNDGDKLLEQLRITFDGDDISQLGSYKTAWKSNSFETRDVPITVELPLTTGNEYQGLTTELKFKVEAVQGNASVVDDGQEARLDGKIYNKFADVVKHINTVAEFGAFTYNLDLLHDIEVDKGLNFYVNEAKISIDGNGYSILNTSSYVKDDYANRGIIVENSYYSNGKRPQVNIENLHVEAQCDCFYAADTCDVTLNNCSGVTKNVDAPHKFDETVLGCSYDSTLTVNGGEFVSSKYGASVYSSGGKITLNNVNLKALIAFVASKCDVQAVSNSTIVVNDGTYDGTFDIPAHTTETYFPEAIVTGGDFSADPTAFVDTTKYEVAQNEGRFIVTPKSVD